MPFVMYEIRVVTITRNPSGPQTQETLYLARPETTPDPGPLIAACNPTPWTAPAEASAMSWEARITRITVSDDQSQIFEPIFTQRVATEPALQSIIDAYGPSRHAPTPAPLITPRLQGG
jgi:hypothetical protein